MLAVSTGMVLNNETHASRPLHIYRLGIFAQVEIRTIFSISTKIKHALDKYPSTS